jgi:ADP-L-glycero-D-manno-heptose 6-epimerase
MDDDETDGEELPPLNVYAHSTQSLKVSACARGMKLFGMKYLNLFGPNENHKVHLINVLALGQKQIGAMGKVQLFHGYRPRSDDGSEGR